MNRQSLIDLASNSVKNYSTNVYPSLVDWLDEGQIDIVRRTECFTDTKTLTSVSGTREYQLGTDVMKILAITYDSKEVQPTTLEQAGFYNDYPSETNATPSHYYIKMTTNPIIGFTPAPGTSSLTISVHYVKRPDSLVTTTNNPVIPEQYQRLIVKFAMYNVLIKDVKLDTLTLWQKEYLDGVSRMAEEIRNFDKKKSKRMEPYGTEHRQKSLKSYSRRA